MEARFLLEPLEEREALPRESNADPGFVVLPDEGAAVSRRPGGDMVLLEEDDVDVAAGQVEGDARPHASSAHHDDLGFLREARSGHRVPDGVSPYRRFHISILDDE